MKKQLFSFLMVLALVVLAGTSAMAQTTANGLTPGTARLAVVGSVSTFSVLEAGNPATYSWDVFEIASSAAYDAAGGATVVPTKAAFRLDATGATGGSSTTATVYVQWLSAQTAGNVYVVEATSTSTVAGSGNATCTTKRRFFVSVFNYTVDIVLCDASGNSIETSTPFAAATQQAECNSWAGRVIRNLTSGATPTEFEGDLLTLPENYANTVDGLAVSATSPNKTTQTYFKITVTLTGAPNSFDLEHLNWRLRYTLSDKTDLSLYEIKLHNATPAAAAVSFASASGSNTITGVTGDDFVLAIAASDFAANSAIYFKAVGDNPTGTLTTADYIFQVSTHNNLGAKDMLYRILIDQTALDLQGDAAYNDGYKYGVISGTQVAINKPETETRRINMSPATSVINIVD